MVKPLESNEETYLTAEQYDYARKTGDWESGKTFNHRKEVGNHCQMNTGIRKVRNFIKTITIFLWLIQKKLI